MAYNSIAANVYTTSTYSYLYGINPHIPLNGFLTRLTWKPKNMLGSPPASWTMQLPESYWLPTQHSLTMDSPIGRSCQVAMVPICNVQYKCWTLLWRELNTTIHFMWKAIILGLGFENNCHLKSRWLLKATNQTMPLSLTNVIILYQRKLYSTIP